jgi:hypothetical protein
LLDISKLKTVFDNYRLYKDDSLKTERIIHNDILEKINALNTDLYLIELLGRSIEGREIFTISCGNGNTNLLIWSQMHGDEPTATSAIFDILSFFSADDNHNELRSYLLNNLRLHFIPMLNPDGAEIHKRENILYVDINRDAQRKLSPEGRMLAEYADRIKPEFAFNLHDQNSYYTAGRSRNTSAISFLVPPFDFEKSINLIRMKGMQIIGFIAKQLFNFLSGQISRYKDDFEPRAFGDTFVKNNITSILIESGFLKGDLFKNEIRKLNFIALLSGFYSIAAKQYTLEEPNDYFKIPENEELLFDLLLKNVTLSYHEKSFKVDIGIRREKNFSNQVQAFYYTSKIIEIGDLSIYSGIEEYDFNGYYVEPPKIYNKKISRLEEISLLKLSEFHKNEFAFLKMEADKFDFEFINYPINVIPIYFDYSPSISLESNANLLIKNESGIQFIVINGFLQKIGSEPNSILNGVLVS